MQSDIYLESLCLQSEDPLDLSAKERNHLGDFLKGLVLSKEKANALWMSSLLSWLMGEA